MKVVIVTGSRTYRNREAVFQALDDELLGVPTDRVQDANPTQFVVVHGACPTGADHYAHEWVVQRAGQLHRDLIYETAVPAPWELHAKQAGPTRNGWMDTIVKGWYGNLRPRALVFHDQYPDLSNLLHAWGGGTADMAKKLVFGGVGLPFDRIRFFTEQGEVT